MLVTHLVLDLVFKAPHVSEGPLDMGTNNESLYTAAHLDLKNRWKNHSRNGKKCALQIKKLFLCETNTHLRTRAKMRSIYSHKTSSRATANVC